MAIRQIIIVMSGSGDDATDDQYHDYYTENYYDDDGAADDDADVDADLSLRFRDGPHVVYALAKQMATNSGRPRRQRPPARRQNC